MVVDSQHLEQHGALTEQRRNREPPSVHILSFAVLRSPFPSSRGQPLDLRLIHAAICQGLEGLATLQILFQRGLELLCQILCVLQLHLLSGLALQLVLGLFALLHHLLRGVQLTFELSRSVLSLGGLGTHLQHGLQQGQDLLARLGNLGILFPDDLRFLRRERIALALVALVATLVMDVDDLLSLLVLIRADAAPVLFVLGLRLASSFTWSVDKRCHKRKKHVASGEYRIWLQR